MRIQQKPSSSPKLIFRKISPREYESLQGTRTNEEKIELLHFKRLNQNKKIGLLFSNTSHTYLNLVIIFSQFNLVFGVNLYVPVMFSVFLSHCYVLFTVWLFYFFYFVLDFIWSNFYIYLFYLELRKCWNYHY